MFDQIAPPVLHLMPTIIYNDTHDLKLEIGTYRYWLLRLDRAGPGPEETTHRVHVEKMVNGEWQVAGCYSPLVKSQPEIVQHVIEGDDDVLVEVDDDYDYGSRDA